MHAALTAAGFHTPTPIQAETIAPAIAGHDVIGTAQTGTGKTAAFMIPIVERLRAACDDGARRRGALVLAPTRELAEQIHQTAMQLGCGLRTAVVVGGVAFGPQIRALQGRPSVIIATPGRLVDHLERRTVSLQHVGILVLDEADRMLDMGFKAQLDRILQAVPTARQTLLFSATMPAELGSLVQRHVRNPVRVDVGQLAAPPSQTVQDVYVVDRGSKTTLLLSLIEQNAGTMLVFCRTKHLTDRIARKLCDAGHAAQRLHSNRSQSQRREALDGFRGGRYRVLVATDVAARGIDVVGIERVINYDLPTTVEDYVHRIGRTARAGAAGHATSFASPDEHSQLRAIERHIGRPLPRQSHGAASERPMTHNVAPERPQPAAHTPRAVPRQPTRKQWVPKRAKFRYRDQRSA
jgi:ATP-dependent RNA helicase RhlE